MVNDKLKTNLDNIQELMQEKNLDWVHVNFGGEGTGKSSLALQIARYLDTEFDVNKQVAFNGEEFRHKASALEPFKPIIYDEAIDGLYSRNAMTKENKKTVQFIRKCREMNLFIIINLPDITELDKAIKDNRAKSASRCVSQGWAHLYNKNQLKQVNKDRDGNMEYPKHVHLKTGWKDPAKQWPELWQDYQVLKMQDIEELEEDIEDEEDVNYLSTGDVAERLGVSTKTVRNWCNDGKLRYKKLPNGDRRIPEKEIFRIMKDPVSPDAKN